MDKRTLRLQRNFSLLFWIQALTSVQVMNAISTIFMVHRGLTLSQIFQTAILFSLVSIVFEVPSSYLADKWGRKKVIILSILFCLGYWITTIFADSFVIFLFAFGLYAVSNSMISGTDEALIYDSSQELGQGQHSLKQLGKYFSAQRMFKVVVPLIAVLIAKDLSESQFIFIIFIDLLAVIIAIVLSIFLTEPKHFLSVEKIEAGILKDSIKLFRQNPMLLTIMQNRTMVFVAAFILWRIYSDFFLKQGMPILEIGIITTLYQGIGFIFSWHIDKISSKTSIQNRINFLNIICTAAMTALLFNSIFLNSKAIYQITFIIAMASEVLRWPLFSQILNSSSKSYNRATVLSLANGLKSVIDIPLLLLSSVLISLDYRYLFVLIVAVAAIPTFLFKLNRLNRAG